MKIIRQKKDLKQIINAKEISFVPTMGSLHKGHEFLIKKARKKKKKILVSIFVNPKQFNSRKDYLTYPRNLKKDIRTLKRLKVDYAYCPNFNDIFSFKTKNKIYLHPFSQQLCGRFRPGHFEGVLKVVNRFLEILNPKYVFLGQKDFQQLILIKKHISKSKISTLIIPCQTVRLNNSLPYSSRNNNLNYKKISLASKIIRTIQKEKKMIKKNKIKKINLTRLKEHILELGVTKLDYIECINLKNLKKAKKYNENFNIFSAFYIDNVRLIDNF